MIEEWSVELLAVERNALDVFVFLAVVHRLYHKSLAVCEVDLGLVE